MCMYSRFDFPKELLNLLRLILNANLFSMFEFQEDSTLENGAKKLKEWKDELGK